VKLTGKILLYLDYDLGTGLGHISRSRSFIEALFSHQTEIYICSKLNPKAHENHFDFLKEVIWLNIEEAKLHHYLVIYVDTYDKESLEKLRYWHADFRVVLIDSNYSLEIPTWAEFIIDIERTSPRNYNFEGEYLFGDLLTHSELELSRTKFRDKDNERVKTSSLAIAVNFGGSVKVLSYLQQLRHTFVAHEEVDFSIYCPMSLSQELKHYFLEHANVEVRTFTSKYLRELSTHDLLITTTGTSFLEGLYINIPMVIFSLFPNAESNFDKFRNHRQVLFSGTTHELESFSLASTLEKFHAKNQLEKIESGTHLDLVTIGQIEIQSSLAKILE